MIFSMHTVSIIITH